MRETFKKWAAQALFQAYKLASRVGLILVPSHYHSGIPSWTELERTRPYWSVRSQMPGIQMDADRQAARLHQTCVAFQAEYQGNPYYQQGLHLGRGFGYIEAQALHGFIRYFKPARVLEVGSGVSSWCAYSALRLNQSDFELIAVEPHPQPALRELPLTLFDRPVQSVPLSLFEDLKAGDLLFVDSSHTVKPGGDVNFLIGEVLPRLNPGVFIHFHDINFPFDHQRDLRSTFFHWSETSLLRAYLTHNRQMEILFCLSFLHYDRPEQLQMIFPEYRPEPNEGGCPLRDRGPLRSGPLHFPSSIYLQVVNRSTA